MKDKVVFAVSIDPEDEPNPPRESLGLLVPTFRAVAPRIARTRLTRISAAAVGVMPVLIAAIMRATSGIGQAGAGVSTMAFTVAVVFVVGTLLGASSAPLARAEYDYWRDRFDVMVGQVLASWVVALATACAAIPVVVWTIWQANFGWPQALPMIVVLVVELGVAASFGVAVGHLKPERHPLRSAASVGAAILVLPALLYGASLPFVTQQERITHYNLELGTYSATEQNSPNLVCVGTSVRELRTHTQRVWWVLAASPLVAVVDAPLRTPAELESAQRQSWEDTQQSLRQLRVEPELATGYCREDGTLLSPAAVRDERSAQARTLSWGGLAISTALAVVALLAATVSRRRRW